MRFPHVWVSTKAQSPAGRPSGVNTSHKLPSEKVARAQFLTVGEIVSLPYSLVDAFLRHHPPRGGGSLLLRFLSPITVPGGLQIKVSQ